jgi:hypothetical protein
MRRIPYFLLSAVLCAAFLGAPAAHAIRTERRASQAEAARRSFHRHKSNAHAFKRARSRGHGADARLRPAVLTRSGRAHPVVESDAAVPGSANRNTTEPESTEANATDQAPAVESASLESRRKAMPPPLRGSYESLVRQNEKTEADGLERIEDDDDLADRIARKMLVPVPVSAALTVNGNLPENRRYCRPWTAKFLTDLARAHAAEFQSPLEVSSAVRTVAYQKELMKVNGNATAAEGDVASPHLTGATIDIAKQNMSRQEIGWMRDRLLKLQDEGKIDVEEEFQQSCFHITVYKSYVPPRPARKPYVRATAKPASENRAGL